MAPLLPLELHHLIITEVAFPGHRMAYQRDTVTLARLRLVSSCFNTIVTPLLYSSIFVTSYRMQKALYFLCKSHPQHFLLTHSLCFSPQLVISNPLVTTWEMGDIITSCKNLRRICHPRSIPEFTNRAADLELHELSILTDSPLNLRYYSTFRSLRRAAVDFVDFQSSDVVDTFLQLHELRHLVITSFDVQTYRRRRKVLRMVDSRSFRAGFAEFMKCASEKPKVTLGVESAAAGESLEKLRSAVGEGDWKRVSVVYYGNRCDEQNPEWFQDRVRDGTVWCLEDESRVRR